MFEGTCRLTWKLVKQLFGSFMKLYGVPTLVPGAEDKAMGPALWTCILGQGEQDSKCGNK